MRQIEYIALRQQRLRETKQNSDELMDFLGFNDVEDFGTVGQDDFIDCSEFVHTVLRSQIEVRVNN